MTRFLPWNWKLRSKRNDGIDTALDQSKSDLPAASKYVVGPSVMSVDSTLVGRDVTMISGVNGQVSIIQGASSNPPSEPREEEVITACTSYAERLRQRYGRLDLEVLTPLKEQDEHPVIELREVFIAQAVRADPPPVELPRELLHRLAASEERDLDLPPGVDREAVERVQRAYMARPARPILEVLNNSTASRIVLLGDPGAGKSTLGRFLALALTAGNSMRELSSLNNFVPLIVELRSYAEAEWRAKTFEEFLDHVSSTEGLSLPSNLLKSCLGENGPRRILMIFDGLDELFEKEVRSTVAQRIAAFSSRYPSVRIIVTSRRVGYQRATLDAAGFTHYMLQDLDRQQIADFATKWFTHACPGDENKARRLTRRVTDAVEGSASVRELAGNPLILTILAIIGRRRELPRDRRTVYEHAVAVLVEHWDPSKYLRDRRVEEHLPYLGPEDKLELLRLVARRMQEGSSGIAGNHIAGPDLIDSFESYLEDRYSLPRDRAAVAARIMLQQFRERNFILSRFGGEVYGFVHRTFLEYLAAVDIAHRFHKERSLSESDLVSLLSDKWRDSTWNEVLLLLVGLVDERYVAQAIDRLLDTAPSIPIGRDGARGYEGLTLSFRYLSETRRLGVLAPQSRAASMKLAHMFEAYSAIDEQYIYPYEFISSIASAVSTLGAHWAGRQYYLDWYQAVGAKLFREDDEVIANSLSTLIGEIATSMLKCHPDSSVLREWAQNGVTVPTRCAAIGALGEYWPDEQSTRDFLARAVEDEEPRVRMSALAALRHVRAAADMLSLAREWATGDPLPKVRSYALNFVAYAWGNSSEASLLVRERAVNDEDSGVRDTALRILGSRWIDEPSTLPFMRELVAGGEVHLRPLAVQMLASHWGEDPETAVLVRECLADNEAKVRASAVEVLASHWGEDPETAVLVRECLADEDALVRSSAVEVLANHWGEDPGTAVLVRECLADNEARVRVTAIDMLGGLSGGPHLVPLLRECIATDESAMVRETAVRQFPHIELTEDVEAVLRNCLTGDEESDVRLAVAEVLAENNKDHPISLDLLQEAAINDSDSYFRRAVLELIVENYAHTPAVSAYLRGRGVSDPDWQVRAAAIRLLAQSWGADSETLVILNDRATHDAETSIRQVAKSLLKVMTPGGVVEDGA